MIPSCRYFFYFFHKLICSSRIAVDQIDDPAVNEAERGQRALHQAVIGVSIGADVIGEPEGVLHGGTDDAAASAVGGNLMERDIGLVVQPFPAVDHGIGRVSAGDHREGAEDLFALCNEHQMPFFDFVNDLVDRRLFGSPLVRVSVFPHRFACGRIDGKDAVKIAFFRFPYLHHSISTFLVLS